LSDFFAGKGFLSIESTSGLHKSESSKGQIININLPRAAKSISFRCKYFAVAL